MEETTARNVAPFASLDTKAGQQARQQFAQTLLRLINGSGGAANFLSLLIEKSAGGECAQVADVASPGDALEKCAVLLRRSPDTQRSLMRLFSQVTVDCTALTCSAPSLQVEAEQVVWLQFRRVLESDPAVSLGVREFVDSVRSGECVLFNRDTDEDTIVESLFPDYKYLIVSKGAEQTAQMLPELFNLRHMTSERINHFHKTAGSEDCKVVEVDGPKTEVRKELRDLEARKLHIVTKDLIEELYEFYRQEMISGVRATTGAAHVPSCDHHGCSGNQDRSEDKDCSEDHDE